VTVTAQNLGDVGTAGPVSVVDKLPRGWEAKSREPGEPIAEGFAGGTGADERGPVKCKVPSTTLIECAYDAAEGAKDVLPPYETLEILIKVVPRKNVKKEEVNEATISGGGDTRTVSASSKLQIGSPASFGIEEYRFVPEEEGGSVDTQAGSHPFQLTTTVALNNSGLDGSGKPVAVGLPRDIGDELPTGFLGDPTPFAQCTDQQFAKEPETKETEFITNECPASSAVGVATVKFNSPGLGFLTSTVPIFNVVPRRGEPVRFGFKAVGIVSAFLDASVRTGGDYGVTVTSENIPEEASVLSVRLTFWGVPGDKRHDASRGWECMYHFGSCLVSTGVNPPPLLAMPTSCEEPYSLFSSTMHADSWPSEGNPSLQSQATKTFATDTTAQTLDGCVRLPFEPEIRVTPDVQSASTATGLNVDVHVPQEAILNSESLAESAVRGITVALPAGVAVNPSGGDGLEACSEGLAGYLAPPTSEPPEHLHFTPTPIGSLQPGLSFCTDAAKIGTVKISLPILPHPVQGAVYLASQNENPFGSLLALYLMAEDPISGVVVKLAGESQLCPAAGATIDGIVCETAGQIVSTFKNSPQAPFEDAELHFFGGERAPLATPAHCGAYTTRAIYTPWSGNEPVPASSTFDITSGPNHTPCPGASLPFSPSLTGGTINNNGGAFSPLSTTISREDGQQDMAQVTLHMPPGLSGLLTGVKLCPEAQANEGTCPAQSLIGETTVSAGIGSDPVSVTGGKVYITEKYGSAPFGLSIVNPVKAGPFDLERDTSKPETNTPACDCVVVRAKINVDPVTAALTVTTNTEAEGHGIPHFIDGIPVQIRKVNVLINRPGFTFNPTDCKQMSIGGAIESDEKASSPVSVPFDVANCATLGFKPSFKVSTSGKTSRQLGASLHVSLEYPKAPFGSQANIASVKVELPKQLPSNLKTLQKACPHLTFEANPAGCPAVSRVGTAKAITPLLPVPLAGPAYFVSYGGSKFPELIIVLQGYGVTLNLHGETFIDEKTNVTSSTFHTVPDAPVGSFELSLPQGEYSALAAPGGLCNVTKTTTVKKRVKIKTKGHTRTVTRKLHKQVPIGLVMPTTFTAQNGATFKQSTQIAVEGCPKPTKGAKKASSSRHRHHRARK
jgi:hypothetical protein